MQIGNVLFDEWKACYNNGIITGCYRKNIEIPALYADGVYSLYCIYNNKRNIYFYASIDNKHYLNETFEIFLNKDIIFDKLQTMEECKQIVDDLLIKINRLQSFA